jgi:hypothetical protein
VFGGVVYFGDIFGSAFYFGDMFASAFLLVMCMGYKKKVKTIVFEALIVSDVNKLAVSVL